MAFHDTQYLNLVRDVLQNGRITKNRTGDDARKVFARQMRFDLRDHSIPLLTSKKMFTRGTIVELCDFFIAGATNINVLKSQNVNIWNDWATPEGHLNRVYGVQWRAWEDPNWRINVTLIDRREDVGVKAKEPMPEFQVGRATSFGDVLGYDGIYNGPCPSYNDAAYNLWTAMMEGCYDEDGEGYDENGRVGAFVDQHWLCFANFLRDLPSVPGFNSWVADTNNVHLSNLYYGGLSYHLRNCAFVHADYASEEVNEYAGVPEGCVFLISRGSDLTFETTMPLFYLSQETDNTVECSDLVFWEGVAQYEDFTIVAVTPPQGKLYRQRLTIDQLETLVNTLKTNPHDRRLIVSAWNVADLEEMALPPCHYLFQCDTVELTLAERIQLCQRITNVTPNPGIHAEELDRIGIPRYELSLMLNQRSADVALGVPFNIVQYSMLLHMLCKLTNMAPGDFIWSGGNVHIYEKHVGGLLKQLQVKDSELAPSPTLKFADKHYKTIDSFRPSDFIIEGYQPGPEIRFEISV